MNNIHKILTYLEVNKLNYSINDNHHSNDYTIAIYSPKIGHKILFEYFTGGFNFHFSIEDIWCFDVHEWIGDSVEDISSVILKLLDQFISENLVGILVNYGSLVKEYQCKPDEINTYIKKIKSFVQNNKDLNCQKYKITVRSFKGTYDNDLEIAIA